MDDIFRRANNPLGVAIIAILIAIAALASQYWPGDSPIDVTPLTVVEACVGPPLKYVDPDNLIVVYMSPESCNITAVPLNAAVPSIFGGAILQDMDGRGIPILSADDLPKDWYRLVTPNNPSLNMN